MKTRTLAFKLITGGVIAVLIPLMIVGIFAAVKASDALEAAARDRAMKGAHNLADMVQGVVAVELKVAGEIAISSEAANAATGVKVDEMNGKLAAVMAKVGKDYEAILITDADGTIVSDGNNGDYKGISLTDREYFRKAKSGNANVGSVVKSKKTGNAVATVCTPIMKDGTFVGAVVVVLKIDYLSEKVTAKVGETGYGFMTDQKGLIIAHPRKEFILELDLTKEAGMHEIMSKMLAKQIGSETYVFKDVKKVAGFAPVELTGWCVGLTQNADEFLAAAHSIRNFILIIGIIFLIATALAVAFFARSISSPIKYAVEQMGEAANQVAAASNQVSSTSQQLAEGASEQASTLEETSSSLEEMSSMTRHNAGNASEADVLMKQASNVIDKANDSMNSLTVSMKEISSASEETSKIVKTIDEIAFQTNLLALNAAVEAARAGEAGAGFAVVADEVRNLAMRASEAAKNTSDLIEHTVKKIKDGSDLVAKTNNAFAEVSTSSKKVDQLVGEIAAASQEQAQGIDHINRAVAEMDKVIQQTAASAEESASASEEMSAQAEQMKHISLTLVRIIGGNSNGADLASKSAQPVTKGVYGALTALIAKKKPEGINPYDKKKRLRAEEIIPLAEGDFKDF